MNNQPLSFLEYELDSDRQLLTRGRKKVDLRPKTVATLCYLLENRHRVVSKDDLLNAVWPGVDVQDQAVFQSISELRALFRGHDCIETVRGCGYRWVLLLATDRRKGKGLSLQWLTVTAISVVLAAGFLLWWGIRDSHSSFTVVVNPAVVRNTLTGGTQVKTSIDHLLVEYLQRMGWDAQRASDGARPENAFLVEIAHSSTDSGLLIQYSLRDGLGMSSGTIISPTPLGLVRDLATELHGFLSLTAAPGETQLSVGKLFAIAKTHLDNEEFRLGEAYLLVVLAEKPNHLGAQIALMYAYDQLGQKQDALRLGYAAHAAAVYDTARVDRMMSAILLSQMLSRDHQYDKSERFALEALSIASTINDLVIVAEAQEQLGEISLAKGKFDTGRDQLNAALQYYSAFCPSGEIRVSKRLAELKVSLRTGAGPENGNGDSSET